MAKLQHVQGVALLAVQVARQVDADDPALQGSLKRSATTNQGHWASVSVSAVSMRMRRVW